MIHDCSLEVGDSFVLSNKNERHLHVIIAAESHLNHSQVILVYISSADTRYKDTTTIIKPGEHPFITKTECESWVRYQNPLVCSRDSLHPEITHYYGKIQDNLLERIQDGFLKSKNVQRNLKILFNDWKMGKLYDPFHNASDST